MKELLITRDVRAYFRTVKGEEIKAVDGVSLTLSEGEVLGIAGESGCGKSTLSSVLSFTINPPLYLIEGEIRIDGQNALLMDRETLRRDVRGRYISVVPQGAMNALNPTIKIGSLIADVMQEHFPELKRAEALERAKERVRALSLPERVLNLYPHQLSGGMKQRVIIVISTLLNPSVLIADEPTSALDVSSQKTVIRLMVDLLRNNIIKSIIFITHELPLLRHFADRIAIMYAGKIVEIGPMEDVIFRSLHPYTKALMSSILVPEPEIKQSRIEGISGIPPDLKNPPSGCRFHPRCPYKMDICEMEEPEGRAIEKSQVWCWMVEQAS